MKELYKNNEITIFRANNSDLISYKWNKKEFSFSIPDFSLQEALSCSCYFGIEDNSLTRSKCNKFDKILPLDVEEVMAKRGIDFILKKIIKNDISLIELYKMTENDIPNFACRFISCFPSYRIPNIVELCIVFSLRKYLTQSKSIEELFDVGVTSSTLYSNPHYRYVIRKDIKSKPHQLILEGFSNARTTIPVI